MKPIFVAVFSLLTLCSSCSANSAKDSIVTIGTFNIEWLGDGDSSDVKHRTEADYKNIAKVIEQTEADILGVEEIENPAAMGRILRYLPDYNFLLSKSGHAQNVGVIYKNSVKIDTSFEYLPLATRPDRNRPGFVVHCTRGNFDWLLMVVHLKSTSRFDSTKELRQESFVNRREQAHQLRLWMDSVVVTSNEKDVIVVGDFNDFPHREQNPTLTDLINDSNVIFLSREQKSCKDPKWFSIDHLVASPSVIRRWMPLSLHNVNIYATLSREEANGVSDHCPVVGQFNCTTPDGDLKNK